jgi:hypothetical protein
MPPKKIKPDLPVQEALQRLSGIEGEQAALEAALAAAPRRPPAKPTPKLTRQEAAKRATETRQQRAQAKREEGERKLRAKFEGDPQYDTFLGRIEEARRILTESQFGAQSQKQLARSNLTRIESKVNKQSITPDQGLQLLDVLVKGNARFFGFEEPPGVAEDPEEEEFEEELEEAPGGAAAGADIEIPDPIFPPEGDALPFGRFPPPPPEEGTALTPLRRGVEGLLGALGLGGRAGIGQAPLGLPSLNVASDIGGGFLPPEEILPQPFQPASVPLPPTPLGAPTMDDLLRGEISFPSPGAASSAGAAPFIAREGEEFRRLTAEIKGIATPPGSVFGSEASVETAPRVPFTTRQGREFRRLMAEITGEAAADFPESESEFGGFGVIPRPRPVVAPAGVGALIPAPAIIAPPLAPVTASIAPTSLRGVPAQALQLKDNEIDRVIELLRKVQKSKDQLEVFNLLLRITQMRKKKKKMKK